MRCREESAEEEVKRSGVFPPSHGLALFEVPPSTTMEAIRAIFNKFGTVVGVKVTPLK